MISLPSLTNCLWFATEAEEAARFYTSIFKDSEIVHIARRGKAGHEYHQMEEGTVLTVEFRLGKQKFLGLNGGTKIEPNYAVSFVISCESQEEVDYYWERLGEGADPQHQQCGWIRDKFGITWQVVPTALTEMLTKGDKEKVEHAMEAMFPMKKLDMNVIRKAYNGETV